MCADGHAGEKPKTAPMTFLHNAPVFLSVLL